MNNFVEVPASKSSLVRRKLVYGIGINDAEYIITITIDNKKYTCPYYSVWRNMLKRCYSIVNLKDNPTYIDCHVCKEWHLFSTFKTWMINQDWEGKHLDKDILVKNNKEYSPDKCIFISLALNNLLLDNESFRGKYKLGVSYYKPANNYQASCSIHGKLEYLGRFPTEEEAYQAYVQRRIEYLIEQSNSQTDVRIKNALLSRIYDY